MKKVLIMQNSVIIPSNLQSKLEFNVYLPFSIPFSEIYKLRYIDTKHYDAILLFFPEISIGDIKQNNLLYEISKTLPIILVASFIDDSILKSLEELCFHGCLVPPFSDEQLCSTIELACHNHRLSKRYSSDIEKNNVESKINYELLLSNLPGMAYRCDNDRDWTMRFVSEGCYKLTGYASEAIINNRDLTFNDIINLEYRDRVWQKWQIALFRKEFFQDEYTITTATGEIKWVWEQGKSIYEDNGEIIAIEGFITDITEKKR